MSSRMPYILDTTMRDGEQAPGVVFNTSDKLAIASLLDRTGVQEVESGTPAMGQKEIRDMSLIHKEGFRFKTLAWCRAIRSDIDCAMQTGTNGVHISFPVSSIHLKAMNKSESWVLHTLRQLIPFASGNFEYVTIGAQDASRAEYAFLQEFCQVILKYKVKRIRIADTVGMLNPFSTYELMHNLCGDFPSADFEFHAHNDLGMATANALAAFRAGATCIDTTVNGLGERAGNTPLDELILALSLSLNIQHTLDTTLFTELAECVARASGIPLPVSKPVTGQQVLSHESGIHTNLLLRDRNTYQLIPAHTIGKTETDFVYGKHSGVHAFKAFLKMHHLHVNENKCKELANQLKQESMRLKRNLTPSELLSLIEK